MISVCYCLVSVFPSLIQHYQFMTVKAVGCSIYPFACTVWPLFSVAEHSAAAWQRGIVLKGREELVSFGGFPAGSSQDHLLCSCHGRNVLYAPVHLEEAGAAFPLPPSFSVSLKKNKIGIKERKKCVVHKSEIAYPEIQRPPTTSW